MRSPHRMLGPRLLRDGGTLAFSVFWAVLCVVMGSILRSAGPAVQGRLETGI